MEISVAKANSLATLKTVVSMRLFELPWTTVGCDQKSPSEWAPLRAREGYSGVAGSTDPILLRAQPFTCCEGTKASHVSTSLNLGGVFHSYIPCT